MTFKRPNSALPKTKNWTIGKIFHLLKYYQDRHDSRWNILNKFITDNSPSDRSNWYLPIKNDVEYIRYKEFRWHNDYQSYSIGSKDSRLNNREERLDFLTLTDKDWELGQEFEYLYKLCVNRNLSKIKMIFENHIDKYIKEILFNNNSSKIYNFIGTMTIDINNSKVYVEKLDQSARGYQGQVITFKYKGYEKLYKIDNDYICHWKSKDTLITYYNERELSLKNSSL